MNRPVTAVFAALEALLVVGIGVGLPVVVLSLLWAFQYGLQIDWIVFWRAAVDIWLVGHGVDLDLQLGAATAAASGVPGAEAPFAVTIAALGFSVLTVLLGVRAGRAVAETAHRVVGVLSTVGVFALLSLLVTATAQHPLASPVLWQGILLPTLVYAVPVVVMAEVTRRRRGEPADPVTGALSTLVVRAPRTARVVAAAGLRIGTASAAGVLAVSGVVVGVLMLTHYGELITLYEGAHAGLLGGIALTLGQLALLPDLVVWAASWFVGPGFALGTGSGVSPLGTSVGPMPAVPFLGALPTASSSFAFVGLLVPVVAAFVVTTLLRPRIERLLAESGSADVLRRVLVGVSGGVVAGVLLGLLAWSASGAAGPGRLAHVGPDPLLVGAFGALEVAVPSVLAMVVSLRSFLGHDDDSAAAPAGGARAADDVETGPQPVLAGTSAWSRSSTGAAATMSGLTPERASGLSPERTADDRTGTGAGAAAGIAARLGSGHDETTDLGAEPLVSSSGAEADGDAGDETDHAAGRRRRLAERIRRLRPRRRTDGTDIGDDEDSGDTEDSGDRTDSGDHAAGEDGAAEGHGGAAARSDTRTPPVTEADTGETAVVETGLRAPGDRVHDPREVHVDAARAARAARDRDRDQARDREEHDDERDGPAPWWRRLGSTPDRSAPGHDDDETEPVRGLDR
ncbi:hypothetical protein IFT77_06615 [Frigoribacterium sp. CFBP 13729]|uniref:cell division protein PerM n=1 Tax=Frigoribacterium sp. CFBP 13729 TaxID=2775293 RepID=UPI0017866092|nr:DUF6350 family protein [Frigoribacterium sp. CFBP 13729]MBD8610154.1 hypothetical protein [Frigoribacterium sp. CFBP 13729]